jgi:membrane protein
LRFIGGRWLGGLGYSELSNRVWRESSQDNVFGTAAELAYYFLLSMFPLLIFISSVAGFVPALREDIVAGIAKAAPADVARIVEHTLRDALGQRSHSLLSFGFIGSLLAASNGVVALIGTLNTAYEVKERRPYWKVWLIAIALTVGLSVLLAVGASLIIFGNRLSPLLSQWLSRVFGLGSPIAFLWRVASYIIGLALLFIGLEGAYYFGPDTEQEWRWITPGAVFAIAAAAIGSLLFSFYLKVGPSYSATYGSLGAVIVLMLWLYLVGLAVLIGGEINSAIEAAGGMRKPLNPQSPAGGPSSQP